MAAIEVEELLKEVSAEAPAGADVEFDPAYFELEKQAAGTPESVMGKETKPAEEADWKQVKGSALELFGKTRDLRVAMILATALLKEDGLGGFRDGVLLVKGFLERLWEHFYPKLDPEDNNDPTLRVNILKGFDGDGSAADLYKFKQRLREAVLTNSQQRIGKFSFRDVQIAKGEIPPPPAKEGQSAAPPDMGLINAAFEDTSTEDLIDTQTTIQATVEAFTALDATLAEKVGGGIGPDLTELKGILGQLKGTVDEQLGKRGIGNAPAGGEAAGEAGTAGGGEVSRGGGGGVALTGEIGTRSDVVRVLEKICEYYERFEPTSPVPIFMKRAKRLVTMNFLDVIKDLAPDAMARIDVFTGEPSEPPPG